MTELIQTYAEQVDTFLNDIRLLSDHQREVLLGDNAHAITSTQGHVLMLLSQHGPQTNSELAGALGVTPAAITKAMKNLAAEPDSKVLPIQDENDGRVVRWSLTALGISLASAHAQQHRETLAEYADLFAEFTPANQAAISQFLTLLNTRFTKEK
ncbi:MAG: MarR family transcriptional regulator [Lactobacillaceae bacterium]|jgi:DNA-binding MarR family transcriptional regulator|nr:MarR family transcriptional regulator [Lactobacillaceae bacterium]